MNNQALYPVRLSGALLLALALVGCSTAIQLTSEGEGVRRMQATDTPIGCNLLGDVAIGIPPDAARPVTEEELIILMRNKVAAGGGNVLVVDSTNERQPEADPEPHWVGRGISYACPEDAADPHTPPEDPEQTAGGEEGGDEGGEGGDEAAEDDDALLDDLAGD